jgi:UDP-2,3-diacylglucosamine pyrophosphatase LpxH
MEQSERTDGARETIVFSDFHLAPASPDHPHWMRYRNRRFFVDVPYAALVDRLLAELGERGAPGAPELEVVFNGDMFELDGADGFLHAVPDRRDADIGREETETAGLAAVLRDHEGFVAATGRLLARAERVVFLAGNHDIGLYWPSAQAVLIERLVAAARAAGAPQSAAELTARVVFRQWFHRSEDGRIYVEHGQQYDPASSLPDPLVPTRGDGRGLWISFGSAGFRHILRGIGTMNPHDHNTFIMSAVQYGKHWLRYYAGKGRSLGWTWLSGSWRCARHMLGQRSRASEPPPEAAERAARRLAEVTDLSPRALRRLRQLHARPITERPYFVLRELWLDRIGLGAVIALVALLGLLLLPWPWDLALTALSAVAFWLYERHAPASDIMRFEERLDEVALAVSEATGARLVLLGHTHHALDHQLPGGVRLINSGSWAPAFLDPECTRRAETLHTFVRVVADDGGVRSADLLAWDDGRILAWSEACDRRGELVPADPSGPEVQRAA